MPGFRDVFFYLFLTTVEYDINGEIRLGFPLHELDSEVFSVGIFISLKIDPVCQHKKRRALDVYISCPVTINPELWEMEYRQEAL